MGKSKSGPSVTPISNLKHLVDDEGNLDASIQSLKLVPVRDLVLLPLPSACSLPTAPHSAFPRLCFLVPPALI